MRQIQHISPDAKNGFFSQVESAEVSGFFFHEIIGSAGRSAT
jgi:hypothetical protein